MKIGFIGCGNMGGAIAVAIAKSDNEILLNDISFEKVSTLVDKIGKNAKESTLEKILTLCDFVFLGIKPQIIESVLFEVGRVYDAVNSRSCLVSMAAGVSIWNLERYLQNREIPIIRIMPNMPVYVSKGVTAWCGGEYVNNEHKNSFRKIMEHTGFIDEIPEKLIDGESAIAGCGPAFVYMFIEALADGGVRCGLPRDKAIEYAANTLIGSAISVLEFGKHPEELKDMVCSPGGSTIEGVKALEDKAFRGAVIDAVGAAYKKTKELSK